MHLCNRRLEIFDIRFTDLKDSGQAKVKWGTEEESKREALLSFTTLTMVSVEPLEIFQVNSQLAFWFENLICYNLYSSLLFYDELPLVRVSEFSDLNTGISYWIGQYYWNDVFFLVIVHFRIYFSNMIYILFRYHTHQCISSQLAEDRPWRSCWTILYLDWVCFP